MSEEEFEKLVKKAILKLPPHIRKKMDNVAIVIKKRPSNYERELLKMRSGSLLLGLYQGVPQTVWGRNFMTKLPDKITIFQEPIEMLARTPEEISELVKITVWHEIAHHFGFNETQVRKLQQKWQKQNYRGRTSVS
ncbi:metallopeptidase family protein [bacterium]|nr:metallopeptidase family protein [bacterium]